MVISANMTGISGFYKGYEGRNDLHFFGESLQMTAPKPYQLLKSKFALGTATTLFFKKPSMN